jgi:hypothetical protein
VIEDNLKLVIKWEQFDGVGAFFVGDGAVDGIGKEVRPRLTPGLRGRPRG